MVVFDVNAIKDEIVDEIKKKLCPENTFGVVEFAMNTVATYEVAQSFYPYSTAWRSGGQSFPVDLNIKKTGTPSGSVYVYLCTDESDVPGTTITGRTLPPDSFSTDYADVSFWMDLSDLGAEYYLGSYTKYWIKLSTGQTVDVSNYYSIQRDSVDTHYWSGSGYYRDSGSVSWSTLNADIRFKASFPTWIYPDYPLSNLSLHAYPRIAVDLVARPRTSRRWVDWRIADYTVNLAVVMYSRYPREMGDLISLIDRTLWQARVDLDQLRLLNPSNISPAVIPKQGLFARTMLFQGMHRETASNT